MIAAIGSAGSGFSFGSGTAATAALPIGFDPVSFGISTAIQILGPKLFGGKKPNPRADATLQTKEGRVFVAGTGAKHFTTGQAQGFGDAAADLINSALDAIGGVINGAVGFVSLIDGAAESNLSGFKVTNPSPEKTLEIHALRTLQTPGLVSGLSPGKLAALEDFKGGTLSGLIAAVGPRGPVDTDSLGAQLASVSSSAPINTPRPKQDDSGWLLLALAGAAFLLRA